MIFMSLTSIDYKISLASGWIMYGVAATQASLIPSLFVAVMIFVEILGCFYLINKINGEEEEVEG